MLAQFTTFSGRTLEVALANGPTTLLLERLLESGTNGSVYRARELSTSKAVACPVYYAVKATGCRPGSDQTAFARRLEAETALHARVAANGQGQGVVAYHAAFEETTSNTAFIVLDYIPGGDLFERVITRRTHFWRDDVLLTNIFLQIIDAVAHCHAMGVYHRDIKPENVLVDQDGEKVYLADFGLATAEPVIKEFGAGSPAYMSPESLGVFGYHAPFSTRAHDVWSLGTTLLYLLTGCHAWPRAALSAPAFAQYLLQPKGFFTSMFPVSAEAEKVLRAAMKADPRKRATLSELREMAVSFKNWWMTNEELLCAPAIVRDVAMEYASADPVEESEVLSDAASRAGSDASAYSSASEDVQTLVKEEPATRKDGEDAPFPVRTYETWELEAIAYGAYETDELYEDDKHTYDSDVCEEHIIDNGKLEHVRRDGPNLRSNSLDTFLSGRRNTFEGSLPYPNCKCALDGVQSSHLNDEWCRAYIYKQWQDAQRREHTQAQGASAPFTQWEAPAQDTDDDADDEDSDLDGEVNVAYAFRRGRLPARSSALLRCIPPRTMSSASDEEVPFWSLSDHESEESSHSGDLRTPEVWAVLRSGEEEVPEMAVGQMGQSKEPHGCGRD